jgi:Skp family chaperone for outer membrane proteins
MSESTGAILVVDLDRVLDESAPGRAGARSLQARFDEARAKYEALAARGSSTKGRQQAAETAAAWEREALKELEVERARLRQQVLDAARPALAALVVEKKARIVLDARACLVVADGVDVTAEVIRRLA